MITATYDLSKDAALLNSIIVDALIRFTDADIVAEEMSPAHIDVTYNSADKALIIALKAGDIIANKMYSKTYNITIGSSPVDQYLQDDGSVFLLQQALLEKSKTYSCSLNLCKCMFIHTATQPDIDIKTAAPLDCYITPSAVVLSAVPVDIVSEDSVVDGILSINGITPVNGNIDIDIQRPMYFNYSKQQQSDEVLP